MPLPQNTKQMCVIIYKPSGITMPSDEILKAAYNANPHGCGFVSPSTFYKGLSYRSFKEHLTHVSINEPCIIHFRLATHGSIKKANCHPFRRGDVWFAHNGILSIRPVGDMTDSETALQNIIAPAIQTYGWNTPEANAIVNQTCGHSKFALMRDDEVVLFGQYIHASDGSYYSNNRFIGYLPTIMQKSYTGYKL